MRRRRRKQKTPEQMRRRANRRHRFFHMIGRLFFLGVLVAAAVLALTIFFKVETVKVEGATRYTAEEIIAGMNVKQGDNLYLWNKVKESDMLLEKFPYLQTVQMRRRLPDTVEITVTECSAVVAVPYSGGYLYVSAQGKALEQSANDGGLPVVVGATLNDVALGCVLTQENGDETEALLDILQNLDAAGMLEQLSFINLSDLTDIRIGYQDRFDIRLKSINNLSYYLRFAQTVIDERLSPSDIGRLYWDAQNRLHFIPDTADNVARSGMASASTNATEPAVTDTDTSSEDGTQEPSGTDEGASPSDGENPSDGADEISDEPNDA